MATMKIFKNYYTAGYTERYDFNRDKVQAISSDEITVILPEGAKEVEFIAGRGIELANGEVCDKILTQHYPNGNAIPYIVDCSGDYPKNVFLKIAE